MFFSKKTINRLKIIQKLITDEFTFCTLLHKINFE